MEEALSYREFFDSAGCVGTLATTSGSGAPNAAIFGSARLLEDGLLAIALGDNRSLRNLGEEPRAVFLIAHPGSALPFWRGVRLYLTLARIERDGDLVARMRDNITSVAGRSAGRMIRAVAVFRIDSSRPLLDMRS